MNQNHMIVHITIIPESPPESPPPESLTIEYTVKYTDTRHIIEVSPK